tara:strand:+ start:461 stop:733 length:273 start_codon:yes stop_codon:yes gene_type:complete
MSFKNLKNLVKDYTKTSKTKWAIKEEMASMYAQDAADTAAVLTHILGGKFDRAENKLSEMDTLPRDNAVLAIIEDMGNDWAKANIGWSFK